MLMTSFLKNRKSVREFKNKKASSETIQSVKSHLRSLEEETENIKFRLYENGDFIFERLEGIGGYGGIMIESPHYIGLEQLKEDKATIVYSAYYMEKLISELNNLGLETCWINVGQLDRDLKDRILGEHVGKINYMLALGYGKRRNPFANEPISERLGVDELVFSENIEERVTEDELEQRGLDDLFYYVRFAPSNANLQPWRFVLKKDRVILTIKHSEGEKPNLMDAGIVMYYFTKLARSVGIEGDWKLLDGNYRGEKGIYEYIAEIKI